MEREKHSLIPGIVPERRPLDGENAFEIGGFKFPDARHWPPTAWVHPGSTYKQSTDPHRHDTGWPMPALPGWYGRDRARPTKPEDSPWLPYRARDAFPSRPAPRARSPSFPKHSDSRRGALETYSASPRCFALRSRSESRAGQMDRTGAIRRIPG